MLCDYNDGGCGASGAWSHYKDVAIAAWNQRADGHNYRLTPVRIYSAVGELCGSGE